MLDQSKTKVNAVHAGLSQQLALWLHQSQFNTKPPQLSTPNNNWLPALQPMETTVAMVVSQSMLSTTFKPTHKSPRPLIPINLVLSELPTLVTPHSPPQVSLRLKAQLTTTVLVAATLLSRTLFWSNPNQLVLRLIKQFSNSTLVVSLQALLVEPLSTTPSYLLVGALMPLLDLTGSSKTHGALHGDKTVMSGSAWAHQAGQVSAVSTRMFATQWLKMLDLIWYYNKIT